MLIQDIKREWIHQLQEMWQFKFNLVFANFSILIMLSAYLNYFDGREDKTVLFFLLFVWYFATHSITHPSFFVEDEIIDRTIISVIQSKKSIGIVLLHKIIVQILIDVVKAIPLFLAIYFVVDIKLFADIVRNLMILMAAFLTVFGLYGLGFFLSGFCLIFSRTSNITGLISHFILFFAGILPQKEGSIWAVLAGIFPFHTLKKWIVLYEPQYLWELCLYGIVYWMIGAIFFHQMYQYTRKRGNLFHV